MADKIGAKLSVEGESSYSKAMKDAAKNTRALNSELKLAEAQFKASGNAQELYASKGKILREQLQEQERAVQAAKTMLEQLANAGYAQNSTKVMEWRSKLAQAQQSVLEISSAIQQNDAALNGSADAYDTLGESMQNAANDARTAKTDLSNTNTEAVSLKDALQKIGINIGWEGLRSSLDSINKKIDQVISRAVQMGKALWDAGVDATVWADELATQSIVTGIDTKTLQQWDYAARFVDTSVDTIISSRKKLLQNMESTNKQTVLNFNDLGVVTRNADGSLRNVNDVFWDSIEALGRISDETQRDAQAMNIFGKSAAELNPLIKAGRDEWERYAESAPVMSDEKIGSLTDANDAIEDMNAQLEALKLDVLAEMAPMIEQVAEAISSAASSMREFMETEEGKQALTRLQTAVSGLLESFTEQDFGKILSDASTSITGLIDGLSAIIENKDGVVNALKAIGGGVVALNVAEAAAALAEMVESIKLLSSIKISGNPVGGPASPTPTATTGGKSIWSAIGGFLTSSAAKAVGGAAAGGYVLTEGVIKQEAAAKDRAAAAQAVVSADEAVAEKANKLGESMDYVNSLIAGMMHDWGVDAETAKQMYLSGDYDNDWSEPPSGTSPFGQTPIEKQEAQETITLTQAQTEALQKYWDVVRQGATIDQEAFAYQDLFDAFADSDASLATLDAIMEIIQSLPTEVENVSEAMSVSGQNIVVGLANGINSKASVAISAAAALANAVAATISSALRIASPSKVMQELGGYVGEGFAIGIENSASDVARASQAVLGGLSLRAPAINAPAVRQGSGAEGGMAGMILSALSQMKLQIDGHTAGQVMLPTLEDLMAEQTVSRRWES